MELELSVTAFGKLYSGASLVLVGADVACDVSPVVPDSVTLLVLHPAGLLTEEDDDIDARKLAPVGMGLNILGIIAGKETAEAAAAWQAFSDKQKMFEPVRTVLLKGLARTRTAQAQAFLIERLAEEAKALRQELGEKEAGLAFFRNQNERFRLDYEKARRMLRGAGFGPQHIAADLPRGQETVGPGGTLDTRMFRQTLPCDTMALWTLSLYAVPPASSPSSGYVSVKLWHAGTGACLATRDVPYEDIVEWTDFDFSEVGSTVFGDAILEIEWHEGLESAPLFSLSSIRADRYGDGDSQTLAMRMIKGFVDPGEQPQTQSGLSIHRLVALNTDFRMLRSAMYWPFEIRDGGYHAHLISSDDEKEYIQTHASSAGPSAVFLPDAIACGVCAVSAKVETAHPGGPNCRYFIVVLERDDEDDAETGMMRLRQLFATGDPLALRLPGTHVAHIDMAPNQAASFRLEWDEAFERKADMALVVTSLDETAEYGWCRWSDITFGFSYSSIEGRTPLSLATEASALRLRVMKFPELAGRIEFLLGRSKLDELSRTLGFSPLLISEETGSLQTHPLKDYPSAAVLGGATPHEALRVACDVETAHDAAPAFIYVLAVVDSSVKDRERVIGNMLSGIKADDEKTWQGVNGRKTVQWHARLLYARQAATLEMEIMNRPKGTGDLVFAVLPAGDSVSYGWCRWYSLSITSAPSIRPASLEHEDAAAKNR